VSLHSELDGIRRDAELDHAARQSIWLRDVSFADADTVPDNVDYVLSESDGVAYKKPDPVRFDKPNSLRQRYCYWNYNEFTITYIDHIHESRPQFNTDHDSIAYSDAIAFTALFTFCHR
jgi:hypothetical protein